jgi:hypothetical protein
LPVRDAEPGKGVAGGVKENAGAVLAAEVPHGERVGVARDEAVEEGGVPAVDAAA